MRKKLLLIALTAMMLRIAFTMSGCSPENSGSTQVDAATRESFEELTEAIATVAEQNPVDAEYAADTDESILPESTDITKFNPETLPISDMIQVEDKLYAIIEDGVLVHDLTDGSGLIIPTEERLTAIIDLGEKILVGGTNLYCLKDDFLFKEDAQLDLQGPITAFARNGIALLIGTTDGLYQIDRFGVRELAADIPVSAMAVDPAGVWIGTAGEGLYYWDGQNFRKRYLRRDTTLFDNVMALQYNHAHLYLGTENGLFVYDGGRWQPYGLADGLPSEMITAINADDWVVKIGTANGPVNFFDNEFKLMSKLEGTIVNRFLLGHKSLMAATVDGRILMKSGGLVSTLFNGEINEAEIAFEDDH